MPASQPLSAVLLLAAAVALLLAALANPAAAAVSGQFGGSRMVILRHAPGTRVVAGDGAAGAHNNNKQWRYYAGRVEDEVAPEFGGMLATNSNGGRISTGALNKDRPGCQSGSQCAAKPAGGSYTRPCTYRNMCPH
ncbi:unnamed protein product [Urochloa decumbens]|uniref:Uncharacterized protein n=1 Tax=Urochloa decumbens TaxID=240449 RepID=A0ABC8VXD2_9POAL